MHLSSAGRYFLGSALAVSIIIGSPTTTFAAAGCSASADVFLNPFSKRSAHHRPIGTGAKYASSSHPTTRDWLKASRFSVNPGAPWGVDVAAVDSSDPLYMIAGKSPMIGLPATIRLPRGGLQTDNPSGRYDGVTVIYDRSTGKTHEFFRYDWNNGRPKASIRKEWDIRGLGHGTATGQRLGTSASGIAMLFGILRGHEINTPGRQIGHALQVVLPAYPQCNTMLSRQIVLPATSRDGFALRPGYNSGHIPYGALMALPRTVNIASLGLSEPGRRLAEALQNYGAYVVDNGGCIHGAIRADQHVSAAVRSQLSHDIPKFYGLMRMVLNNNVLGSLVAGDGTPLAPNCGL